MCMFPLVHIFELSELLLILQAKILKHRMKITLQKLLVDLTSLIFFLSLSQSLSKKWSLGLW